MVLENEASLCNALNVAWMERSKHELGNWVDDNNINIQRKRFRRAIKIHCQGPTLNGSIETVVTNWLSAVFLDIVT